ncbi:MAG: dTDP-4-dehydrorhamnose reductase [Chitinophagaceae bacterium]|nr:dTDP-4-dehydrorhamnose reductase [Chitinophagaceae bacterium]
MNEKPLILVTGANGQLGMELSELAVTFPQFNFYFTDRSTFPVQDKQAVMTWFIQHKPAYCINCAAYTAVDKAEEPGEIAAAFAVNADAPGYLAAAAAAIKARLIHISTDYVFDGKSDKPYKETDATNPQGVYALSKLKGEEAALQHSRDTIVIRTSWLYGAKGQNFVNTMIRLMQEKDAIGVVNDQFGSPTYAADLARAILQIIQHTESDRQVEGGIFHFCNSGITNWYGFAVLIRDIKQLSCEINPIPTSGFPTRAKRPQYSVLDTDKINRIFGIRPASWEDALRRCIAKH